MAADSDQVDTQEMLLLQSCVLVYNIYENPHSGTELPCFSKCHICTVFVRAMLPTHVVSIKLLSMLNFNMLNNQVSLELDALLMLCSNIWSFVCLGNVGITLSQILRIWSIPVVIIHTCYYCVHTLHKTCLYFI